MSEGASVLQTPILSHSAFFLAFFEGRFRDIALLKVFFRPPLSKQGPVLSQNKNPDIPCKRAGDLLALVGRHHFPCSAPMKYAGLHLPYYLNRPCFKHHGSGFGEPRPEFFPLLQSPSARE